MAREFVLTWEAAKILDVPQHQIWQLHKSGKLPAPVEYSKRKFGWSVLHLQREAARRATRAR